MAKAEVNTGPRTSSAWGRSAAGRRDPAGEYRRTLRLLGPNEDLEPFSRLRTPAGVVVRRMLARRGGSDGQDILWPDLHLALRAELEPEACDPQELAPSLSRDFTDLAAPAEPLVPGRA